MLTNQMINILINILQLFSGTKWCGHSHIADNYNDLGEHRETDKCCRAHDKCPRKVKGFRIKYGYFNWRPNTISECKCDDAFRKCLKAANSSEASREVENIYFEKINPPCIILRKKAERSCVRRSWFVCKEYKTVTKLVAELRKD